MTSNFWLSEEQFNKISPLLPNKPHGGATSRQLTGLHTARDIDHLASDEAFGSTQLCRREQMPRNRLRTLGGGLRLFVLGNSSRLKLLIDVSRRLGFSPTAY